MDQILLDQYHATPVTVEHRSGVMADVRFAGFPLRLATGFCAHAAVDVALYYTGREPSDALSALSVCPQCGVTRSIASLLRTPAEMIIRNQNSRAIFGYIEQRYMIQQRSMARGMR